LSLKREMFKYLLGFCSRVTHSYRNPLKWSLKNNEKLPKELVNKVIKDYGISEN